jgi:hypothetical protein
VTDAGVTLIELMVAGVTESGMLPEMIPEVAVIVATPAVVTAVTIPEGETARILGLLEVQLAPAIEDVLPSELLPVAVRARVAFIGRGGSCSELPAAGAEIPAGKTVTLCKTGVPTPNVIAADNAPEAAVIVALP